MLEVKNLSYTIQKKKILKHVHFSLRPHTIMGFVGPNGAGKTTTMDIISGCIPSWNEGDIQILGYDLKTQSLKAKSMMGYASQEAPLYQNMSVKDLLSFQLNIHRIPKEKETSLIEETLSDCRLEHVAHTLIRTLSKGYRRRVTLAQALVHRPPLLLLDEPSDSLDPFQILELRHMLEKLKARHGILISSHILSELEKICDDVTVIHEGHILYSGPIKQDQSVEELFFSLTKTAENLK